MTQWYVPISYTVTSDMSQFQNLSAKIWLIPGQELSLLNVLQNNDWIILNNQGSGEYFCFFEQKLYSIIEC